MRDEVALAFMDELDKLEKEAGLKQKLLTGALAAGLSLFPAWAVWLL